MGLRLSRAESIQISVYTVRDVGVHLEKTYREIAHCDRKSVAVRDFVVYNGLNVDGLQLEVNCNIDQSGKTIYNIEFLA